MHVPEFTKKFEEGNDSIRHRVKTKKYEEEEPSLIKKERLK